MYKSEEEETNLCLYEVKRNQGLVYSQSTSVPSGQGSDFGVWVQSVGGDRPCLLNSHTSELLPVSVTLSLVFVSSARQAGYSSVTSCFYIPDLLYRMMKVAHFYTSWSLGKNGLFFLIISHCPFFWGCFFCPDCLFSFSIFSFHVLSWIPCSWS